jgi:hypothetical protein
MKESKQKSIKFIWSVLCQSSSIDVDSNSVSIFNTVEEIKASFNSPKDDDLRKEIEKELEKPSLVIPVQLQIVTLLQKTAENTQINGEIEVEFMNPEGKSIFKTSHPLTIPVDKKRLRDRMKINGLTITTGGEYSFKVRIKENRESAFEEFTTLPLDVMINRSIQPIQ